MLFLARAKILIAQGKNRFKYDNEVRIAVFKEALSLVLKRNADIKARKLKIPQDNAKIHIRVLLGLGNARFTS